MSNTKHNHNKKYDKVKYKSKGKSGGKVTYITKEKEVSSEDKLELQKLMVGHYIERVPDNAEKNINYVMQGNGIYQVRKNKLGTFVSKVSGGEVPGLASPVKEGWEINVPRIPITLLGTTVSFFRKIYQLYKSEVHLQFFYDTSNNSYLLYCPNQTVSPTSVEYDRDNTFETPERILVAEIHSHASMGAFFSSTDDADEKDDRFYGVIGKLGGHFPEIKMRLTIGQKKIDVEVEDLFDVREDMYYKTEFPESWLDKVKREEVSSYLNYYGIYGCHGRSQYSGQYQQKTFRGGRTVYDRVEPKGLLPEKKVNHQSWSDHLGWLDEYDDDDPETLASLDALFLESTENKKCDDKEDKSNSDENKETVSRDWRGAKF